MCAINNSPVDNATYDRDIATSGNEDSIAVFLLHLLAQQ